MIDPLHTARLLWRLRWLLVAALLALAFLVDAGVARSLAGGAAATLITINVLHSVALVRVEGPMPIALLLALDLAALSAGLAASGGVSNPLIGFMVVPLAIAAITLPWRLAAGMAAAAVVLYGLLSAWHFPLPLTGYSVATVFHWHLWGMWANFALTALLMVASIAWLSMRLNRQHEALTQTREHLMRREAVIAVATEAAVTSHEMSTPLSTATMMTGDLQGRGDLPSDMTADLQLIGEQLHRCRAALQRIRSVADEARERTPQAVDLATFTAELAGRFAALNPRVRLHRNPESEIGHSAIYVEPHALTAALLNLLENAAEADDRGRPLTLDVRVEDEWAAFHIDGPGVCDPFGGHEWAFPASSKNKGLGVGVLLSHSTIEQAGGQLVWNRPERKGAYRVSIRVPLHRRPSEGPA